MPINKFITYLILIINIGPIFAVQEVAVPAALTDAALHDAARVLKPGGTLILSTPNLACLPNRLLLALGIQPLFTEVSEEVVLGRRLRVLGQGGQPVGHLRVYTKPALLEFLTRQGFQVVRLHGVPFHEVGLLSLIEKATSIIPGLAMIFVVVARKPRDAAAPPG